MASSSYTGRWKYDVFVCFRGETRAGFASDVADALSENSIKTFMDTKLEKTESITKLVSILKDSALSVVILSPDFAASTWCLDEVAAIAESVKTVGQRVLPVFYNVDPSDVTDDSGTFAAAIDLLVGPSSGSKKRWRDALRQVIADKAGLCYPSDEFKGEYKLVKAIVHNVNKTLEEMAETHDYASTAEKWVGMDSRIREIELLPEMKASNNGVPIVGLWGMGGTGKTATAKALLKNVEPKEQDCKHYFLKDINNRWEDGRGLDGLLQELYSALLSMTITRPGLDLQRKYRRASLRQARVFIILDEVETKEQLNQLLLNEASDLTRLFAPWSRVIVTSRNREVLDSVKARVYPIEGLVNPHESLQLFSLHAFGQDSPPGDEEDWEYRFSCKAVSYCKANPLALVVLGGALVNKDATYWRSFLDGLGKSQEADIYRLLRRSYEKLESNDHKRMFLDIACFFNRYRRSVLEKIMGKTYVSGYRCLMDLVGKSLLVYNKFDDEDDDDDGTIEVHDLLREMAWKIVNEEDDPRKRSRLEDAEDIYTVLTKEIKADIATEGISLDLSRAEAMKLRSDALLGMDLLRLLQIYWKNDSFARPEDIFRILLPNGLDYLPRELRILKWDAFPCRSLPPQFSPRKLVQLAMRYSAMEQCWEGVQDLENLRWVDLTGCINLREVPDLSKALNLETLKLQGCERLVELPSHIQYLDKLVMLHLGFCKNLENLPPRFDSPQLKFLHLSHCPKLETCPEITGEWQVLDLDQTPITELPQAINKVKHAKLLLLYGQHITEFPQFSKEFTFLTELRLFKTSIKHIDATSNDGLPRFSLLELDDNSQLTTLSSNTWRMVSTELVVKNCPMLQTLPEVSSSEEEIKLTTLKLNCCTGLLKLPSSIGNLGHLVSLSLIGSYKITALPPSLTELGQLRKLELSSCFNLQSLPDTIHHLDQLTEIYLIGCIFIPRLPQLPPNLRLLAADNCWSLQLLPANITNLNFYQLSFAACLRLSSQSLSGIADGYLSARATSTFDPKSSYTYPGSEIPKWFEGQGGLEMGDSVILQLPENCKQLKGVAFAVVYSVDGAPPDDNGVGVGSPGGLMDMKCDCCITDQGARGKAVASWDCLVGSYINRNRNQNRDHVFVWLDVKGEPTEVTEETWYVKYRGSQVSFKFYNYVILGTISNFQIKKCAARLIV